MFKESQRRYKADLGGVDSRKEEDTDGHEGEGCTHSTRGSRATHALHSPLQGLLRMILEIPGPPKAAAPAARALLAPAHHRFGWPEESAHGAASEH